VSDREAIRDLIDNWVLYRDAGDWKRFREVFHDDGRVNATWRQTGADEFIEASREGMERGVSILHFLGGTTIDCSKDRAFSQTKMTIQQRAEVESVLCDVTCTGRFCDFWERREGRSGLVLRQPTYERDRIDPVTPGASVPLDSELLNRFPEGYRHLAYLQTRIGYTVKDDMPGLTGSGTERLYDAGAGWLAGEPIPETLLSAA
jgi:hypothetical protein